MKLLARTNLYYIFFSVITYVVIAVSFYLVTKYVIYNEVEDRLHVERLDFEHFVDVHGVWEESCYFVEDKITLAKVSDTLQNFPTFKDTVLTNRYNQLPVPFREYSFHAHIGDNFYKVSIRKSLIESNKLLKFITGAMLLLLSIGLVSLFWFQSSTSKKLWSPFYETLSKAKSFEVVKGKGLKLNEEDVFEFNELNSELNKMTDKISRDYMNLKEFTENASHEIQTPLALINSRVEGLIQSNEFTKDQMSWIEDIHASTMRLSRLNQALLLLFKIENGQFAEHEQTNITSIIKSKLVEFEEIVSLKGLELSFQNEGDFVVEINSMLAELLIINLINNAVKHNLADGRIRIVTRSNEVVFSNTGHPVQGTPEVFFERFKKQNQNSGSLGLGLAIVKKICTVHNLEVRYDYSEDYHTLTIQSKA